MSRKPSIQTHTSESGDWGKGYNGVMEYFWMWLVVPVLLLPGRIPIMLRLKLQSLVSVGQDPGASCLLVLSSLLKMFHIDGLPPLYFSLPHTIFWPLCPARPNAGLWIWRCSNPLNFERNRSL